MINSSIYSERLRTIEKKDKGSSPGKRPRRDSLPLAKFSVRICFAKMVIREGAKCIFCSKSFYSKILLEFHIRSEHQQQEAGHQGDGGGNVPLPVQEPEHPSDALTNPSLPEQGAGHQGDSSNNTSLPEQDAEHPSDALNNPSLPEQGAGHQGNSLNHTSLPEQDAEHQGETLTNPSLPEQKAGHLGHFANNTSLQQQDAEHQGDGGGDMSLPEQEAVPQGDALTIPSRQEQAVLHGDVHEGLVDLSTHVSAEPPSEKVLPILNVASEFSKGDQGTTIIKLC